MVLRRLFDVEIGEHIEDFLLSKKISNRRVFFLELDVLAPKSGNRVHP